MASAESPVSDDRVSPLPETRRATEVATTTGLPLPDHSVTSPPVFWSSHARTQSNVSYQSVRHLRPAPIQLEDHSEEYDDQGKGCWARLVTVDDHVVIGSGVGAYIVWMCTVDTLKGGLFTIRKRYSEFDELRANLISAFPQSTASIPELPRKSVISRFRPRFLEHRKLGLSHFLNCIILNPEFAGSPILKDFIFS